MDSLTWLTTREAARRVGRTTRTIHNWRAAGMPVRFEHDGALMLVELGTLLEWYRRKTVTNPVHKYRLRRAVSANGGALVDRGLLSLVDAAKLVNRSVATVRVWRREGMPVEIDQSGCAWVDRGVVLEWKRQKALTSRGPWAYL